MQKLGSTGRPETEAVSPEDWARDESPRQVFRRHWLTSVLESIGLIGGEAAAHLLVESGGTTVSL